MNKCKVCITGSNGFLGANLVKVLSESNALDVTAATRDQPLSFTNSRNIVLDFESEEDLKEKIIGTHVMIHCAGRAHRMNDESIDPLSEFRKVNRDLTLRLAQICAELNVKRFIFISSIKVNGEGSQSKYSADDCVAPTDPYALSKWEAERGLEMISQSTNLEIVIIRPTIIYGPNAKGNFDSILSLIKSRIPLPIASIKNKRSLISIENLIDLIRVCIAHPNAANQTFLASDGDDVSTPELIRCLAHSMKVRTLVFPFPVFALKLAALITGNMPTYQRLINSLTVDIEKTKKTLSWQPPLTLREGLAKASCSDIDSYRLIKEVEDSTECT